MKELPPGAFDLLWLDTVTGASVWQRDVKAAANGGMFEKPDGYGDEVAVYIRRR